jgi:hypothetical protein
MGVRRAAGGLAALIGRVRNIITIPSANTIVIAPDMTESEKMADLVCGCTPFAEIRIKIEAAVIGASEGFVVNHYPIGEPVIFGAF